jgi:hypothetical protein
VYASGGFSFLCDRAFGSRYTSGSFRKLTAI